MRTELRTTEKIQCMEDGGRGRNRLLDAKDQGTHLLTILEFIFNSAIFDLCFLHNFWQFVFD